MYQHGDECTCAGYIAFGVSPVALISTRDSPAGVRVSDALCSAIARPSAVTIVFHASDPVSCVVTDRSTHISFVPFELCTTTDKPRRGDALLLVPRHVCPTVNLAEQALLINGDRSTDVIDIAARAHDLFV